jgi:hypothetical protein
MTTVNPLKTLPVLLLALSIVLVPLLSAGLTPTPRLQQP